MRGWRYAFFYLLRGLIFLPVFLLSFYVSAQVTIAVATGGESICLNPGSSASDYYDLGDIVITENAVDDFSNGNSIDEYVDLLFSNGSFEFEVGVGTLSISSPGGRINGSQLFVFSDRIWAEINFSNEAKDEINVIRISGLRVRATASGSAEIVRTDEGNGDNLAINGNAPLAEISHGSLNAYNPPSTPTLIQSKTGNASNPTICAGESITFTATPAGLASYEFLKNSIPIQSTGSEFFTTSSLIHNDAITVITNNANCASVESAIMIVNVNANPAVTSVAGEDETYCDLNPITLNGAGSGGTPGYSFEWTPNTGLSSAFVFNPSFTPGGDITYALKVTDTQSCTSIDTINIIDGRYAATLSSDAGANTSCVGELVTFTGTHTSSSLSVSYRFFVGGATMKGPSVENTYATATLADGDNIQIRIDDGFCTVNSSNITQTINPLPSIGLAVTASSNSIPFGTAVDITIANSETGVDYELQHNSDGSSLSAVRSGTGSDLAITSVNLISNATIRVAAMGNPSGCSVNLTDVEAISISGGGSSIAPPTASDPAPICIDGTIPELTVTGEALATFTWYGDPVAAVLGTNSTFTPSSAQLGNMNPGTYTFNVTQTVGADVSFPTQVDVVVNPSPDNSLVVSPAAVDVCKNTSTTVTVESSENNIQYQLIDAGTDTPISPIYVGNNGDLELTTDPLSSNTTIKVRATTTSLCESDLTNATVVTIFDPPSAADAQLSLYNDQCSDDSFNMNALPVAAGSTGTWSVYQGSAVISGDIHSPTVEINGVIFGENSKLYWTVSNGVCPDERDNVILRNYEMPVADADGAVGSNSYSASCNAYNFTAIQSVVGSTGTWTEDVTSVGPGTVTFTNANTINGSATVDEYGTYIFRWTESNNSCDDDELLTVTFYEQPTAVIATVGPVNECDLNVDLAATVYDYAVAPSVNSGVHSWSYSGPGAVNWKGGDPTDPDQTGLSVTLPGTYVFTWTETNGTCDDNDQITVNFYEQPVADAGPATADECDLDIQLLGIQSFSGSTASWAVTVGNSGDITFSDNTIFNPIATSTAYGTYTFTLTETNQSACSDTEDIIVTFSEIPTLSSAGPDQEQCNDGSFTLAGNTPTIGMGTWSIEGDANGTVITTPLADNSGVTDLLAGQSVTLRWTISNGTCADSYDEVVLTNSATPDVADAGIDLDQCGSENFIMAGNLPVIGAGMWSIISGPGAITNIVSEKTTITGVSAGDGSVPTVLRWTVVKGSCGVSTNFDDINLRNYSLPTLSVAGIDQEQCNDGSFTLAGNTPTIGTGIWSIQGDANGAVITTPLANNSGVTDLLAGQSVTLRWTISNGACTESYDELILTNNEALVASNVTSNYNGFKISCNGATDGYIEITATGGTYNHTFTLSGDAAAVQVQPGDRYRFTGLGAGDYTIDVSNENGCSIAAPLNLTLSEPAAIAASGSVTSNYNGSELSCYGISDGVLTVSASNGSGGYGYVLNELPANTTGNLNGIYSVLPSGSYTVTVTDVNGCSITTTSTTIDSPSSISASLVSTDMSCNGIADGEVNTTAVGGTGDYTFDLEDNSGIAKANTTGDADGNYNGLEAGSYQVVVTDVNGCGGISNLATIAEPPIPAFTIVSDPSSPGTIDSGKKTSINIQMPLHGGIVTLSNVTSSSISISGNAAVGTIYPDGFTLEDILINKSNNVEWIEYEFTGILNGCVNSATQTVRLFINPAPHVAVYNYNPTICFGEEINIEVNSLTANSVIELRNIAITPDANGVSGFLGIGTKWEADEFPAIIKDNLVNTTNAIQTITYEFEVSANGFLKASTRLVEVVVNPTPSMTITNTNTNINSGELTDILINSPTQNGQVTLLSVAITDASLTGNSVVGASFPDATRLEDVLLNRGLSPQTITYEFEANANGCVNAATIYAGIIVNPAPEMAITNNIPEICSGQAIDITANSITADAIIELVSIDISPDPGGVSGFTVAGQTWSSSLAELPGRLADNLINSTNNIQTVTYEFRVSASGFAGTTTMMADILVNPIPSMSVSNLTPSVNSATGTEIMINTVTENGRVLLKSIDKTSPSLTGHTAVGVSFPDAAVLEDVLLNRTLNPQTITYEFEAQANGCFLPTTITKDVLVYPVPEMTITNHIPTICSGGTTNIEVSSATADAKIELVGVTISPNAVGVTGYMPQNSTWESVLSELPFRITDNLINSTNGIQTITYEFEVSASGFVAKPNKSVSIIVNPAPSMIITNTNTTINSGSLTDILINTPTENGQVMLKSINKTAPGLTGNTGVGSFFPDNTSLEDILYNSSINPETITYEFESVANGCFNPDLITADISVIPTPEMTVTNVSSVICSGEMIDITVSSITANSVIELISVSTGPDAGSVVGYTPVSSIWKSSLSELPVLISDILVNTTNDIQTITYVFEVSALGYLGTTIKTTDVIVNPTPEMTILNNNTTINHSSTTDILLNTPSENGMILLTKVIRTDSDLLGNTTAGASFPDGTRLEDVLLNKTNDLQTITYEFEARGNGCSNAARITKDVVVIPEPLMNVVNNSPILCSAEHTDIVLSSPTVGGSIQLKDIIIMPDLVSGITPLNTSWNTFPVTITDKLVNPTSVTQTVEYVFEVSISGFTNPVTQSVFVEVRPLPDVDVLGHGICSGDVTNIDIWNPNHVNFTVFDWTSLNSGVVTGNGDGSGNKISQPLLNSSAVLDSVVYRIYATAQSCVGDSIDIVQHVNPRNIAFAGSDTTVCQGTSAINIESASIGGSATNIVWTKLNGNGTLSNVHDLVPTYTPLAGAVNEVGTASLQLTASDESVCPPVSDLVSITINPLPVVEAGSDQVLCEGETALLSEATISGSSSFITWVDATGLGSFMPNENTLNAIFIPHPDQVETDVSLYIITNDPAGPCSAAIDSLVVTINQAAVVDAGIYDPICIGDTLYLNGYVGGSANSGTWSGGQGTFLNPSQLSTAYVPANIEKGSDVKFTLTTNDPAGVCFTELSQTLVTVNRLPFIDFEGLNATFQVDDPPASLEGFPSDPVKGVFSGPGINGNIFSPVEADAGMHVIRYTYEDENSCVNFIDKALVVFSIPEVDIVAPGPFCLNDEPKAHPLTRTQRNNFDDYWTGENVFLQEGEYYFNPIKVGEHEVTYTLIDNSTGAVTNEIKYIRVNDTPVIDFAILNNCIIDSINFEGRSLLADSAVFSDRIISYQWEIGEGPDFIKYVQHPTIKFDDNKPDTYKVVLTATSKFNCSASKEDEIEIGAVPIPYFEGINLSSKTVFKFEDQTITPTQSPDFPAWYTDPTSSIDSIWWNFGEGNPVYGKYDSFSTYEHSFTQVNVDYNVKMKIKTNLGCYAEVAEDYSLYESITEFPYETDFNNYNPLAFRGENSSWKKMVPNSHLIKGNPQDTAWITYSNSTHSYNMNEKSFVTLPVFDLRSLKRPMISLDIWTNAESTRDGAVLQYSIDGDDWKTLVDPDEKIVEDTKAQIGLNWYNEKGLVSQPGHGSISSTVGDNGAGYGWTGVDDGWRTVRFPLDGLQKSNNPSIQFRVAFSSDGQNLGDTNYDGFAFDNLWIGERERNVLFEHFDNLNSDSLKINDINELADRFELDLIPIQYHNSVPFADAIYQNNKYPVETRGSIYEINQSPLSFMDGFKKYDFVGANIHDYQIKNQSLKDPLFDIDIEVLKTSQSAVDISVTITARETISDEIIVNVMPIETTITNISIDNPSGIDSLHNVVKDMLPLGGYPYNMQWAKGMSQNFTVTWDLDNLSGENIIYDSTKLGLVVFVQNDVNEGAREVCQSVFAKLPVLEKGVVITGVEDELNLNKFEKATIYPNPATNYFNVSLSDQISSDLDWSIIDQRGVELLHGTFKSGENTFNIDVQQLPVGLHMLIVSGKMDYTTIRKIIINR